MGYMPKTRHLRLQAVLSALPGPPRRSNEAMTKTLSFDRNSTGQALRDAQIRPTGLSDAHLYRSNSTAMTWIIGRLSQNQQ